MRKKSSLLVTIVEKTSELPWWLGLIFAAFTYFYFETIQSDSPVVISIIKAIKYVLTFAFILGSVISASRTIQGMNLFDRATSGSPRKRLEDFSWQEFEILVAHAFHKKGYSVKLQGGNGPDGGVDVVMTKEGQKFLVQCKHWKLQKVGVQTVRELFGVMTAQGATGGFVVTSGEFTEDAKTFSKGKSIQLVNAQDLVRNNTVEQKKIRHLSCPKCGSPLVKRVATRGSKVGKSFLGCSSYPRCKKIISL